MFRIVHTSDLHIDPGYVFLSGDKLLRRRQDFLDAFTQIIDFCIRESPDLLMIAGDFYDRNMPRNSPRVEVLRKLRELSQKTGTQVVITTGNHDSPKSQSDLHSPLRALEVFENVVVFDGATYEKHVLEKSGKTLGIYSRGFNSFRSNQDPVADLPSCEEDFGVVLLHAHLHELSPIYKNDSQYAPFSAKSCVGKGFQYFALGHIHRHQVHTSGSSVFCYPGSTERYTFDEEDQTKGFVVAELGEGFTKDTLRFIELKTRPVRTVEIACDPAVQDIADHALTAIHDRGSDILLRVKLTGNVLFDVYRRYRKNDLLRGLSESFFGVQVVNDLTIQDTERHFDFSTLRATQPVEEFRKYMQQHIQVLEQEGHHDKAEQYREALVLGEQELREMTE